MSLLQLRKVSKQFGAVQALCGVDMELRRGEVLGLMGDNGAGKSTIVKIMAGNLPPSSGEVLVDGAVRAFSGPSDARSCGIEVVYQDLALCDNLSAAENVFLGREPIRKVGPIPIAVDYSVMVARTKELFAELESDTDAALPVGSMSGGQRQAVAIARTRLNDSRVVLMDEPTAAISVRQVEQVLGLIGRLRERGVAILLISHRMPDVFSVADRIIVLRRGVKVADKRAAETSPEEVTGLITGAVRGIETDAS